MTADLTEALTVLGISIHERNARSAQMEGDETPMMANSDKVVYRDGKDIIAVYVRTDYIIEVERDDGNHQPVNHPRPVFGMLTWCGETIPLELASEHVSNRSS